MMIQSNENVSLIGCHYLRTSFLNIKSSAQTVVTCAYIVPHQTRNGAGTKKVRPQIRRKTLLCGRFINTKKKDTQCNTVPPHFDRIYWGGLLIIISGPTPRSDKNLESTYSVSPRAKI
eukprot:GEMP01108809.1.p1 GENE.GEMP01108809.1~~GEMP01108809.1.p1  ORF type:complete len:118 (-),score=6.31 GEMP01108809.1:43-396(-)